MPSDEKEKELLEQIERLKKQLSDEKLTTLSLETLIEVAEEKFNIKIKKSLARSSRPDESKMS